MEYIQLTRINELPDIKGFAPFKAVIALEIEVDEQRRQDISRWLVEMGAMYVMLCGEQLDAWTSSIRQANLEMVDIETMSPEQFVMITEHENERLRTVFWHAKKYAKHTHARLEKIIVIHVSDENRSVDYLSIYNKA